MNKCLYRQFGIIPSDILFTLCTRIKDDAWASCCPTYFHGFADGIYKCFGRERFHDARSSDDRNAALYTQTGIKSPPGYLFATRHGNSDNKRIGLFRNSQMLEEQLYVVLNHLAWGVVDGGATYFESQAGHGNDAYTFATGDYDRIVIYRCVFGFRIVHAKGHGNVGSDFHTVGDVGVVACIFDDGSFSVGHPIAVQETGVGPGFLFFDGDVYGFAIGEENGKDCGAWTPFEVEKVPSGGHGSSSGTSPGAESATQGVKVGQNIFYHSAQTVFAVYGDETSGRVRAADGEDTDAFCEGCFYFFIEASGQSAFFYQYGFGAQLL